jgi:hypothetical protein
VLNQSLRWVKEPAAIKPKQLIYEIDKTHKLKRSTLNPEKEQQENETGISARPCLKLA